MYASFDGDALKEKVLLPSMDIHMYMKNQDSTLYTASTKELQIESTFWLQTIYAIVLQNESKSL